MARSFEERQVTEEIIDKEHRNVCIRWPNSSPCRIGLLLESRIQGRLFGSCRMTRQSEVGPGRSSCGKRPYLRSSRSVVRTIIAIRKLDGNIVLGDKRVRRLNRRANRYYDRLSGIAGRLSRNSSRRGNPLRARSAGGAATAGIHRTS
jgi:hypothetical protein